MKFCCSKLFVSPNFRSEGEDNAECHESARLVSSFGQLRLSSHDVHASSLWSDMGCTYH